VELANTETAGEGVEHETVRESDVDNSLSYDQPPSSSSEQNLEHTPVRNLQIFFLTHYFSKTRAQFG
jgi:hypothetical protein